MKNLQFWCSHETYDNIIITTYCLVEKNKWLFLASDIFNLIDKLNNNIEENAMNFILKSIPKTKIYVFQNDSWKTIDVFPKEDILEVLNSSNTKEVTQFVKWINELCNNVPKECLLPKESKEYEFLNLATNRFMDLYELINNISFMDMPPQSRLHIIRDFFSVYAEMLSYPPIKNHIEFIKKTRPSMESVMSSELVKFIRNILVHFPFFSTWDEIYVSKQLINWKKDGQSIDKFLNKYQGHKKVEYRIKEKTSGEWIYPTVRFPLAYKDDKIFLKDIIDEKNGILLCAVLMFNVVSSQIICVD
ncbi:MAG: hypothetical protein MJ180_04490 [Candidatus Gastranaerophilales bacterium]|nr:hypothetical protein [Candidatus Gastranaerophilales bacterium]